MRKIILKVYDFANGGYAVGHLDKKVVFARFALPGETVEAEIIVEKKSYLMAQVLKVLEPSPYRIDPKCTCYFACGGCDLQHADYEYQLKLKQTVFINTLKRVGGIERKETPKIEPSPKQWNYRKRVEFKCKNGNWGFYKKSTNDFVTVNECKVADEKINKFIQNKRCRRETKIQIDDFGNINTDEMMMNLNLLHPLFYKKDAFTQINREVNLKMLGDLLSEIKTLKPTKILELFSGIGNFTIPLAIEGYEILAVEINPSAISSLKRNINTFGLRNISIAKRNLFEQFKIKGEFDVVILDPPRNGAKEVARWLLKKKIEYIIYISCEPATLSRDLKILKDRYTLIKSKLYDMFPHTHHIESMNILKLNKY